MARTPASTSENFPSVFMTLADYCALAFGLDWVVREAVARGIPKPAAWAMGSLHGATRYGLDGEIGGLGGGRRADLVLLNDDLVPQATWYGGERVVEEHLGRRRHRAVARGDETDRHRRVHRRRAVEQFCAADRVFWHLKTENHPQRAWPRPPGCEAKRGRGRRRDVL